MYTNTVETNKSQKNDGSHNKEHPRKTRWFKTNKGVAQQSHESLESTCVLSSYHFRPARIRSDTKKWRKKDRRLKMDKKNKDEWNGPALIARGFSKRGSREIITTSNLESMREEPLTGACLCWPPSSSEAINGQVHRSAKKKRQQVKNTKRYRGQGRTLLRMFSIELIRLKINQIIN